MFIGIVIGFFVGIVARWALDVFMFKASSWRE